MRILFTCGGTAGHINPALALARLFQVRHPNCEILFVGREKGMECNLIPREGFELRTVQVYALSRSLSLGGIKHNIRALKALPKARKVAGDILTEFRPDLVVGTGGYTSYPVVREAARRGIPTAIHESNAVPGLTSKKLAAVANRVLVGFDNASANYPHPDRVVVTGTPVRMDFFDHTKQAAREALGIYDDRPVVLSYWGSLGAYHMNQKMLDFIQQEWTEGQPFHHLHSAGGNFTEMQEKLAERGLDLTDSSIQMQPYIYDMARAMVAADVVICRAGASTLAELTVLGKPAILVPSPNVTNHHQEKNAQVLADHGGAIMIQESECTGQSLYRESKNLLDNLSRRKEMCRAMSDLGVVDAPERIYQTLMELIG